MLKNTNSSINESFEASTATQKKSRIEFNLIDLIADPANRKPIEEYEVDIRDQVRR